jgi:hypothetical protein
VVAWFTIGDGGYGGNGGDDDDAGGGDDEFADDDDDEFKEFSFQESFRVYFKSYF